jgi:predicted ATPase/DNA-binding winged helix-turn-helix (wHTH) protein
VAGCDYRFGPFLLMPGRRRLLRAGEELRLSTRAFALLVTLVERAGAVVPRQDLIARAWPGTVVEEVNLRVHISALRAALRTDGLAQRYIENVPGQGYCFVAPVNPHRAQAAGAEAARLPILGRDADIDRLAAELPRLRFVSLVGTGGVGKTALADAVAARLASQEGFRLCRADFALADDGSTPAAILADAAGLPRAEGADPLGALARHFDSLPLLVLFDHCEYRLQEAAALAEALLSRMPRAVLLACSREPLLADGETLYRPAPLGLPSPWPGSTAAEVLAAPSAALFQRCALQHDPGFTLSDVDAPALAALCIQLDGLPLAIALSAGLVTAFGVRELPSRRHERYAGLVDKPACLPRRQRTLPASLEWSYQRLPLREQIVLRHLAGFRHPFSLADAICAIRCSQLPPPVVLEIVMALVAKSFIGVEPGQWGTMYRLLNTTRVFALEKLRAAGEGDAAMLHTDASAAMAVRA